MKVVLTWEAKDIKPGLIVKKPGTMGKGTLVICRNNGNCKGLVYGLAALDDGLIFCLDKTTEEIADWLNSNGDVPIDHFLNLVTAKVPARY